MTPEHRGLDVRLRRGDKGDDVKALQRHLNKLEALLLVDGVFGRATTAALVAARLRLARPGPPEADHALLSVLAAAPDPSPELTAAGVTFIAREEVSSPEAYQRTFARPGWPSKDSGITIGIGYDLRFVQTSKLRADWGHVLSAETIPRLGRVLGARGSRERLALVSDIEIPLDAAMGVFVQRMLPEWVAHTRDIYPALDELPPARRTALCSLVFNRGKSLMGDRRREMRRIRELLVLGDHEPVAEQLERMVRLWDPTTHRGLIERRRREATLWRSGFAALTLG